MSMQYCLPELQSVPGLTELDLQEVLAFTDAFERETVYSPEMQTNSMVKDTHASMMSKLYQLEENQVVCSQMTRSVSNLQEYTLNSNYNEQKCDQAKKLTSGDISFLEALLTSNVPNCPSVRPNRLDLFVDTQTSAGSSPSTSPSTPNNPSWPALHENDDDLMSYDDDLSSGSSSPLSVSDPVFRQLLDDVNGPASTEITDAELTKLSVKELNRRLKNMDNTLSQRLKQRRRLLKNRGYAQTCRSRRIRQQKSLTKQNESLVTTMSSLQSQCKHLQIERDDYKKKYENLLLFVRKSS